MYSFIHITRAGIAFETGLERKQMHHLFIFSFSAFSGKVAKSLDLISGWNSDFGYGDRELHAWFRAREGSRIASSARSSLVASRDGSKG